MNTDRIVCGKEKNSAMFIFAWLVSVHVHFASLDLVYQLPYMRKRLTVNGKHSMISV
jgi:hypothetical protein